MTCGGASTNWPRRHKIKFTHVAGHSGHPENERCDELAVAACQRVKQHP